MINAIIFLLGIAGIAMLAIVNFSVEKQNKILYEDLKETREQNALLENQLKEMFEINAEMKLANENYSRAVKAMEAIEFLEREQGRFVENNIARQAQEGNA